MKNILVALALAALPVLAQDAPAQHPQQPSDQQHCQRGPRGSRGDMHKHLMEKFDANKDGQLDEQEKAAMKADFEARRPKGEKPNGPRPEMGGNREGRRHGRDKKFMEKFDANKDGQLDEQEKAAMKADFEARHGKKGHQCPHHHGNN